MQVTKIAKKNNKIYNLKNYSQTYKNFKKQDLKQDIDYIDNKLNAAYNAVERHAKSDFKNKIALYWRGVDQKGNNLDQQYTFLQLNNLANKFANLLHELNIKQQERVFFFTTRIPELYYSYLGTLKRGAIAGTMFAAFGEQAILDRLGQSGAKVVVTEPDLFPRIAKVAGQLDNLKYILIAGDAKQGRGVARYASTKKIKSKKILSLTELLAKQDTDYQTKFFKPDTPAFMLYTSGTTGKPKGVVHAHQAILHEHMSAKYVLDLRPDDVYWCTADPGWVTGVAYEILGTLSNGASTVVYNGRFSPQAWYQIIQDYQVNVWYTAPTAIRMLQQAGLKLVKKYDLSSLRHLASVGEPLNPEPIKWGLKAFGLPFHDNWWQTETGGILIANYPSMDIKLGSMGKPLPGIKAEIMSDKGQILCPNKEGNLVIKPGWPSMMVDIYRRPKKYKSYFQHGYYISGDRAFRDKDNYFWFVGRADDVIKTSGERVGPFEVESALVEHPDIIEAGVIGKPDKLRGEIIKAFVKLKPGVKTSKALKTNIQKFVKQHLAGHAYPREIEFVKKLPKTRSGKIMRRLLKARELGLPTGDTSTLEEY